MTFELRPGQRLVVAEASNAGLVLRQAQDDDWCIVNVHYQYQELSVETA